MGAFDPRGGCLLDQRCEAGVTALELALAIAGVGVTTLVVVAMVLIVPAGTVEVHREGDSVQEAKPTPTSSVVR